MKHQSSLQYRHQRKMAILITKLKVLAFILCALAALAVISCYVTLFYFSYDFSLMISNSTITVFLFIVSIFVISKISLLEKIETDFIVRDKRVVYGERQCKECRKWFNILWPQKGGTCDACLFENYTLAEAKEGLCVHHHIEVEELFREFNRRKKLP